MRINNDIGATKLAIIFVGLKKESTNDIPETKKNISIFLLNYLGKISFAG